MGVFGSVSKSKNHQIQVWYLNQDCKVSVSSSLTVKDLKKKINYESASAIELFLDWVPLDQSDEDNTLEKIVQTHSASFPQTKGKQNIFIAVDVFDDSKSLQSGKSKHKRLEDKLKNLRRVQSSKAPNYEKGANGSIVFEERHVAVFASAVNYALKNSSYSPQKLQGLLSAKGPEQKTKGAESSINQLLYSLGMIHEQNSLSLTSSNIAQKIQSLKSSKEYSDFDPKFVYLIAQIYLKFMLKSKGRIYYIDYKQIEDFGIGTISSKSKIGIIGDFGTGLKDSIELLTNMVINHGVDVIFHLGDVYYAGTPHEYLIGIAEPLKKLRIEAKRQVRFYSIPGNHDYYSWGLPFLCFVKSINDKEFHHQKASYFCLRDELNKWQFLGMDTAFHDSNPMNQIYPYGVGPYVQEQELKWHKHRLENFEGSTVLMTHHPLFSIHQRINGQLTKYRNFSCINPMLSAQMFENLSDISAWFWGHEHSLMFFKDKLFGVAKGRLLGNSSFHVMNGKEHPYSRQKGFPHIPFIVEDKEYFEKYLPLNPNQTKEDYFGLSYALIDMEKMNKDNDDLTIEYWCSPSYSDEICQKLKMLKTEEKAQVYFNEYKLYEERLQSIESLRKNRNLIKNRSEVYLRCQIGLCLSVSGSDNETKQLAQDQDLMQKQPLKKNGKELVLKVSARAFEIQFLHDSSSLHDSEFLHDSQFSKHQDCEIEFTLKLIIQNSESNIYLGVVKDDVQLVCVGQGGQGLKNSCRWVCRPLRSHKSKEQNSVDFYSGQSLKIYNRQANKWLSWQIKGNEAYPCLQVMENSQFPQECQAMGSLWMFELDNIIS